MGYGCPGSFDNWVGIQADPLVNERSDWPYPLFMSSDKNYVCTNLPTGNVLCSPLTSQNSNVL